MFDVKFGRFASFAAAGVVLVLSFWKLTRLELNDMQLFFGVLLSLTIPLLLINMGLLLPLVTLAPLSQSVGKPSVSNPEET